MTEDDPKLKYYPGLWDELYKDFYKDDIFNFAKNFPEKIKYVVRWNDICTCWGGKTDEGDSGTEYFEKNPVEVLEDAKAALIDMPFPTNPPHDFQDKVSVAVEGFGPPIKIRDIGYSLANTFITVKGNIVRKTDIIPNVEVTAHKCLRCDFITYMPQDPQNHDIFAEPFECENEICGRRGPFRMIPEKSTWVNKRKIRIQETAENISDGDQTLSLIDAIIYGYGDVSCPPLGSSINLSGILKLEQIVKAGIKKRDFRPYIEANYIEELNANRIVVITQADLDEMERLSHDPMIIDRIVASTVPSIKGHLVVKEACLCSVVSQENRLLPDGRELRGYIHIMLVGDPSVGKSMIMLGFQKLIPGAQFAAGRGASAKGLTVAVIPDSKWGEGGYVAEAGLLVLADRALALIDEFDKFEKEEQQQLNSALEHGKIPINKGGINRVFLTRCPVIAGLNPKHGRFDPYEPYAKQIGSPPDTLSRYDLVFIMLDVPGPADIVVENHITDLWMKSSNMYVQYKNDVEKVIQNWGKDEFCTEFNLDFMRRWLHHAKTLTVEITPECAAVIREFFSGIRRAGGDDSRVPIVYRHLDGMFRLLIAETRLRHGTRTEMRDVHRVMAIIQESMKAMTDPLTGKLDADLIESGIGKSQRDRIKVLREIIREVQDEMNGAAPLKDIMEKAVAAGMKEDDIEDIIHKLKSVGEILEAGNERYRVI